MDTRKTAVLLSLLATYLCSPANAQTNRPEISAAVTAERTVLQILSDGSILDQFPFDGVPDIIDTGINHVQLESGQFDSRGVINFGLNVIPDGKRIVEATLVVIAYGRTLAEGDTSLPIEVRGYASTGVLELNDYYAGRFVSVFDGLPLELGVTRQRIDVTSVVREVFKSKRKLVGFVLRTNARGGLIFGSNAFAIPPRLVVVTTDAT